MISLIILQVRAWISTQFPIKLRKITSDVAMLLPRSCLIFSHFVLFFFGNGSSTAGLPAFPSESKWIQWRRPSRRLGQGKRRRPKRKPQDVASVAWRARAPPLIGAADPLDRNRRVPGKRKAQANYISSTAPSFLRIFFFVDKSFGTRLRTVQ